MKKEGCLQDVSFSNAVRISKKWQSTEYLSHYYFPFTIYFNLTFNSFMICRREPKQSGTSFIGSQVHYLSNKSLFDWMSYEELKTKKKE